MNSEAIAQHLGITQSAVRKSLQKSLQKIRIAVLADPVLRRLAADFGAAVDINDWREG